MLSIYIIYTGPLSVQAQYSRFCPISSSFCYDSLVTWTVVCLTAAKFKPHCFGYQSQSQSHIATDGQSVSKSWCRAPSGAYDQIFITVWQLRSCWCGALSLTRGRACRLQLLLAVASAAILGSEPLGTRDRILLSQIWDFPFRRLLWLVGSRWRYSTPPPHRYMCASVQSESESESLYDWQSVSLSVLVSSPVWGSWLDI
jgi:hypothetical protein